MRKRAQWRGAPLPDETKYTAQSSEPVVEKKPFKFKKNWWIAVALIGVFLLVLFLNSYYDIVTNATVNPDGQGLEKYYLSGPDPYYNLRLVQGTYETGKYPYYNTLDPLLSYPLGVSGARAPLFNMMPLGFSRLLTPFMPEADAISFSMQFLPALYGALIIFVVYFIGKELFNKKAGLIAAMFVAIIPIHLSSGHGSSFGLFDHDSFLLLMFSLTYLFLIKSIKEQDSVKSLLYSLLGGISIAAVSLVWVEARYLYAIIAVFAGVMFLIDIFTNKIQFKIFRTTSVLVWTGYLISAPVVAFTSTGFRIDVAFYVCVAITIFGVIYYLFGRLKIPWTLSLPAIFLTGVVGLIVVYFSEQLSNISKIFYPLTTLSRIIFGTGIYGDKVSMTIAEANTYQISNTVMSIGPALYWIGWFGFIFLCYRYYKNRRKEYLFIIVLFLMEIWLTRTAGRFLNDTVPLIALLAGWIVWFSIDWIDYKQMIRNIRAAGGGFHGIRRGVKLLHIFGILFIVFIVILPNVYISFDAAIPGVMDPKDRTKSLKEEMFGPEFRGAFGLSVYKEVYWTNALAWLNQQDTNIKDPASRPAFISWWDYGFYEVALGGHPTVADNFQDGIPPAANFHTATSEKEAVSVWIIRLLEGDREHHGQKLSDGVVNVLNKYLGNNSDNITKWVCAPVTSPSYGTPINESEKYWVGQQYPPNAYYHDVAELLNTLDEETVTWLYHDLQNVTGWSIRYYGVEGYDKQIFNIFSFLSDKSLLIVNGAEDDFIQLVYVGYTVDSSGHKLQDNTWTAEQLKGMDQAQRSRVVVTSTQQVYKDPYFETMFYKTYVGPYQIDQTTGSKKEYDYQVPCNDMKHFYAEFISDIYLYPYYNTGKAAVVIAKYYEGAYVNGTVKFNNQSVGALVIVQKDLTYDPVSHYRNVTIPINHDSMVTASDGSFNLIAGAGTSIQVQRNYGQNIIPFVMKNVTFDGENDSAPISDDDAMRKGSNYERFLNITIQPASVQGFVYVDNDDDGSFNYSVDTSLKNVNVSLYEMVSESKVQLVETVITDVNGSFNVSGLLPGYYIVRAEQNGFVLKEQSVSLYEGDNYYNLSEMKHSGVEGKVYYNTENNTISGANVELTYNRMDMGGNVSEEIPAVAVTTTDSNGKYAFTDLIPGEYNLTVTKDNTYRSVETISLNENETLSQNVSLELVPVTTTGYTRYNNMAVGSIPITFSPDGSHPDNTAKVAQVTSAENGSYSIDLTPGYYNVTVEKKDSLSQVLVYSFNGKLENVSIEEAPRFYDISLTKNSTTVSGFTSYAGANIANITEITFEPNENNTAGYGVATSNETGYYTVELSPGSYNVSVSHPFSEGGQNYTYKFEGKIVVPVPLIDKIPYNIVMTREIR